VGDRATVGSLVKEAIKIGYRHIDCSPIYRVYRRKEGGEVEGKEERDGEMERSRD
jgi:diketogulonate reductase-like aldo/keto reductase